VRDLANRFHTRRINRARPCRCRSNEIASSLRFVAWNARVRSEGRMR